MKNKLVLAYSGGLDTSFCLNYLVTELDFEVHTIVVNTGGFTENELLNIRKRAFQLGASTHTIKNAEHEFYETCIKYMIFGNMLKNGTYPLSVSSERIVQAMAVVDFAKKINATHIAHGSTGAGNDQVRFDLMIKVLAPEMVIVSPVRDLKISRDQEISYLRRTGIPFDFTKMKYSINKGLWGTSIGGVETLTSNLPLPEEAYPSKLLKQGSESIILHFEKGELTLLNEKRYEDKVSAIKDLDALASAYAIGRDIHVGDTIIGIKGRVGFEAAAPLVIIKSHHALEKHVLGKWQLYWKDMLSNWYGQFLHEGQYLDPVMRDMEVFLENTQKRVTGNVHVRLSPYHFIIEGVESEFDLMNAGFGDYGEMNHFWSGEDVKGFTKIMSIQSVLHNQMKTPCKK